MSKEAAEKQNIELNRELRLALKSWVANHPKFNNATVRQADKAIENVMDGVQQFQGLKDTNRLEYKLWQIAAKFFQHNKKFVAD